MESLESIYALAAPGEGGRAAPDEASSSLEASTEAAEGMSSTLSGACSRSRLLSLRGSLSFLDVCEPSSEKVSGRICSVGLTNRTSYIFSKGGILRFGRSTASFLHKFRCK